MSMSDILHIEDWLKTPHFRLADENFLTPGNEPLIIFRIKDDMFLQEGMIFYKEDKRYQFLYTHKDLIHIGYKEVTDGNELIGEDLIMALNNFDEDWIPNYATEKVSVNPSTISQDLPF